MLGAGQRWFVAIGSFLAAALLSFGLVYFSLMSPVVMGIWVLWLVLDVVLAWRADTRLMGVWLMVGSVIGGLAGLAFLSVLFSNMGS